MCLINNEYTIYLLIYLDPTLSVETVAIFAFI